MSAMAGPDGRRLRVLYLLDLARPVRNEPWLGDVRAALGERHEIRVVDAAPLVDQLQWADVAVDFIMACRDASLPARIPSLRLWQIHGVGVDGLDRDAWRGAGIPVANVPGSTSAVALAECALMLMLMAVRRFPATQASMREGMIGRPIVPELEGMTLGIVGFGASGRELARRAAAFGMHLRALDAVPISGDLVRAHGLEWVGAPSDLHELLGSSDVMALHLPLLDSTRHLIDEAALGRMRQGSYLVNVARGGLVDQVALGAALQSGHVAAAGLDVLEQEPPDLDDPFFASPNLIVLPHTAGVTFGTSRRRAGCIGQNIEHISQGEEPEWRVA